CPCGGGGRRGLAVLCYQRRERSSGRPSATASSNAWSSDGGGAVDHARQQRQRKVHGSNQPRTRRSACGQELTTAPCTGAVPIFPPARGLVRLGHGLRRRPRRGRRPAGAVVATIMRVGRSGP